MSERAVFLDRDGVLTEAPVVDGLPKSARSAAEMRILDEAVGACASLKAAGFLLVCVSNQPDIARGKLEPRELEEMTARLERELPLDAVLVCPHDDADGCECRKPKPGLLIEAARRLGIDLGASFMVGDRWRDVEAGAAAGARTVFVDRGYDEPVRTRPEVVVEGIEEAAEWIIQQTRRP